MTVNEALMSEAAQQGVESTSNMIECEDVDGNGEGVMAGVLAAVQKTKEPCCTQCSRCSSSYWVLPGCGYAATRWVRVRPLGPCVGGCH